MNPDDTYRSGARRSAGLTVSTFVLGVSFGALARGSGWTAAEALIASTVIFSASAQLALIGVLDGPGSAPAALLTGAAALLRWLPMSLAVAPFLTGSRFRRILTSQAIVDGSFVLAATGDGSFRERTLVGATLAQWPAWIIGTAVGVAAGVNHTAITTAGLDAIAPAFFGCLLVDAARDKPTRAVAAGAAVVTVGLMLVVPPGVALLAAALTALAGLHPLAREPQQ